MKGIAFVAVIMAGYVGMSLGVLKIFWRIFDVHFYAPGVSHPPEAALGTDVALIAVMILCGLSLVMFRAVLPALVTLSASFFIEFGLFHSHPHEFWQVAFVISAIVGQFIAFGFYILAFHTSGEDEEFVDRTQGSTGRLG